MSISIVLGTYHLGRLGIGFFDTKRATPNKKCFTWFEMNLSQTKGHFWLEFILFNHKLVFSWRTVFKGSLAH